MCNEPPVYLQKIFFHQKYEFSTKNSILCESNLIIYKYIQIILSNNILCLITFKYPSIFKIEFHIYNNTLQITDDIVCNYTFPTKIFTIPNNIIEILLLNKNFYHNLFGDNQITITNISIDTLLQNYSSNNSSDYSFDIYNIHILQQIFNLPIKIFNFNVINSTNDWSYNFKSNLTNLKKYHLFNYFKINIYNIHSHIFTEDILHIILNLL